MSEVQFRVATLADAPAIAHTHCASWRTTYPGQVPPHAIEAWANIERRTDSWSKVIATAGESVVIARDSTAPCLGFVSFSARRNKEVATDGQLRAIYLLQSAQGRGLGRKLTQRALSDMATLGFKSACVEVLKDNAAEHFYRYFGARFDHATPFEMSGVNLIEHIYVWDDLPQTLATHFNAAPQV